MHLCSNGGGVPVWRLDIPSTGLRPDICSTTIASRMFAASLNDSETLLFADTVNQLIKFRKIRNLLQTVAKNLG